MYVVKKVGNEYQWLNTKILKCSSRIFLRHFLSVYFQDFKTNIKEQWIISISFAILFIKNIFWAADTFKDINLFDYFDDPFIDCVKICYTYRQIITKQKNPNHCDSKIYINFLQLLNFCHGKTFSYSLNSYSNPRHTKWRNKR